MAITHRTVKKHVLFSDASGKPMAGKKLHVKLVNHSFLFGCGAFEFIPYVNEGKEELKKLTDSWLDVFNYGTLPFYWGMYETEEGKPNKDALMKTASFLKDKNVKVKGHPLCWHTACADWLMKYDNETIMRKQL